MIGTIKKATKILNVISEGKNLPVSLMRISTETGINKATCSHIISTLVEEGYLKKISHSAGYVIGPGIFSLSRFGRYKDDLVSICHPVMKWLQSKTQATVILAVIEGNHKYTIDYLDPQKIFFSRQLNIMPDDIFRTATGKIILANMPLKDSYEICRKEFGDNYESVQIIQDELAKINKKGIVKTYQEQDNHNILGYGAAIFKYSNCVGAIGVAVSCFPEEYKDNSIEEENLKTNLLKARDEISRRLKYT